MNTRRGEKIGWIGSWLGSYSWVLILAILFFTGGKTTSGIYGLTICLIAVLLMIFLSPWRNPSTPYWQLLLPFYLLFTSAVIWAVRAYGTENLSTFNLWQLLSLLPILIPLFVLGNRRWDDRE